MASDMAESNEKNIRVQQRGVQIQGILGVVIDLSEFPLPYVKEEDDNSTYATQNCSAGTSFMKNT